MFWADLRALTYYDTGSRQSKVAGAYSYLGFTITPVAMAPPGEREARRCGGWACYIRKQVPLQANAWDVACLALPQPALAKVKAALLLGCPVFSTQDQGSWALP